MQYLSPYPDGSVRAVAIAYSRAQPNRRCGSGSLSFRHLKVRLRDWLLALALTHSSAAVVLVVIQPRRRAR